VADGAFVLDTDPAWALTINSVLVEKGLTVTELRRAELDGGRQQRPSGR
jgi:hypothetical protein